MHTPILPFHFRLVSLVRLPGAAGREVMNEAVLYHKDAQITACWTSRHVDIRLKRGCCVALRGACFHQLRNGRLPVSRLELIDKPIPAINPFHTIPPTWLADRDAVQRAAMLWDRMGRPLQHLFNAVMWEGGRFYRYVTGPVGCSDYPWEPGRNFRHAVAVAEQAAKLSSGLSDISGQVLIAAAVVLLLAGAATVARRSGPFAAVSVTVVQPAQADLAPVLKQALTQSGVFYEAHQARWVAGQLPTEALRQEPQGRMEFSHERVMLDPACPYVPAGKPLCMVS